MIIDDVLTQTMRFMTKKHLNLKPSTLTRFPRPIEGHQYMLYLHVPFCESLCPYCSFNRFIYIEDQARAYYRQLRAEMRMTAALGYQFNSMYIGGGTPTILVDELIETIQLAKNLFGIREVSCETNPNHLTPENAQKLSPYIQRMSVGVQSFNNDMLKRMVRYDRFGSGEQILQQIKDVAGVFYFLNVDLIFNLTGQTEKMLLEEIAFAHECQANQITFYPLMSSPSVSKAMGQTLGDVNYDQEQHLYNLIVDQMSDAFKLSTVWNFGRLKPSASTSENQMIDEYIVNYGEYIGLGSGSFSYLDGKLYVNTFSTTDYRKKIESGVMSITSQASFGQKEQMLYRFMMDLFGLELNKLKFMQEFGKSIDQGLGLELALMQLVNAFERNDRQSLVLNARGRYLLLVMMREFFVGMNNIRDQARAALPAVEKLQLCTTPTVERPVLG